jgi:hypothetical protein
MKFEYECERWNGGGGGSRSIIFLLNESKLTLDDSLLFCCSSNKINGDTVSSVRPNWLSSVSLLFPREWTFKVEFLY